MLFFGVTLQVSVILFSPSVTESYKLRDFIMWWVQTPPCDLTVRQKSDKEAPKKYFCRLTLQFRNSCHHLR